jgi:uncharacterized membrane protein YkvA (DUF1232 family)
MVTQVIRNQIAATFARPGFDSFARQRLREMSGGASSMPEKEDRMIELLRQYVERAPQLLEACYGAAMQAGVANEVAPILQAAANYFIEPQDYIPDRMGLFGLLDDAYLTHRFVVRTSELYQHYTGQPLLMLDLSAMNAVSRSVIGEPLASQLDQTVDASVQAVVQHIEMLARQRGQVQVSPTGGLVPGAARGRMKCPEQPPRWEFRSIGRS